MPPTSDSMVRILVPAIAGLGSMVIGLSALNTLAAMSHVRPDIGDIVSFTASTDSIWADGTRLMVHRHGQFGCVLDVGVLRHFGGSLVVEGQMTEAAGSFRVHWAGERTAADTANCGGDADLILDGQELDVLALSAGGYGALNKRLPVLVKSNGV